MSDEFHRPTYTFRNGAYNATEVRLYGKPGILQAPGDVFVNDKNFDIKVKVSVKGRPDAKATVSKPGPFDWGLPNFELKFNSMCVLEFEANQIIMVAAASVLVNGKPIGEVMPASWGIIYGYAYEGHCYDLPKPKLMLLPVEPEDIPVNDAGYYEKKDAGYRVWVVDKLSKCVESDVNQGFVEQLVLEANLPGKRSPTMYASRAALGHRGGKLGD